MITKEIIKEFSTKLLSRPYFTLKKLQEEFKITEEELNLILEQLLPKYEELGISVELLELNTIDYLVIFIESSNLEMTNLQLGLLMTFGLKAKMEGGFLNKKSMEVFLANYFNDIQFLIQNNLIELNDASLWSLTPLGALTILPYFEDSIPLLENIITKRNLLNV